MEHKKYKDIYHKIYGVTFRLICDKNPKYADEMIRKFLKKGKIYDPVEDDPHGFVTWVSDASAVIYFKKTKNICLNTISHEAFHAIYRMFKNKNVFLCDKSEEVFAYNLGWLVGEIYQYLKWVYKNDLPN